MKKLAIPVFFKRSEEKYVGRTNPDKGVILFFS
jgi:hypothetical protein